MVRKAPPMSPDQKVYLVARFQEKIEYLEFVTGRGCDLRHFGPSAGNAVQQNEKRDRASG